MWEASMGLVVDVFGPKSVWWGCGGGAVGVWRGWVGKQGRMLDERVVLGQQGVWGGVVGAKKVAKVSPIYPTSSVWRRRRVGGRQSAWEGCQKTTPNTLQHSIFSRRQMACADKWTHNPWGLGQK